MKPSYYLKQVIILIMILKVTENPSFCKIRPTLRLPDDQQEIQDSLDLKNSVTLQINRTYYLDSRIVIGEHQSLNVPSSTKIVFTGDDDNTAIQLLSNGELIGGGTLQYKDDGYFTGADFNNNDFTGLLITGSNNKIDFGYISGFCYGVSFIGTESTCVCYNNLKVKFILNARYGIVLDSYSNGCTNQNYIHADRITIWSQYITQTNWMYSYGIYIETHSINSPNLNTFSGSIEGVRFGMRLVGCYNRIESLRMELDAGCYKYYVENSYYYNNVDDDENYLTQWNYIFGEYADLLTDGQSQNTYINVGNSQNFELTRRALIGFGVGCFGTYIGPRINSSDDPALFVGGEVNAYSYTTNSDIRYKKNVERITNPVDVIKQLTGVSFNFKQDGEFEKLYFPEKKQYGFIAQEIQKVVPELVHKNKGEAGYLDANYIGIIPFLVEAIKEQQGVIERLISEMDTLKKSINQEVSVSKGYQILKSNDPTLSKSQGEVASLDIPVLYSCLPISGNNIAKIKYYIPDNFAQVLILLTDMKGNIHYKYPLKSHGNNEITVSVSDLLDGVYICSLIVDNKLVDSKKFIITK